MGLSSSSDVAAKPDYKFRDVDLNKFEHKSSCGTSLKYMFNLTMVLKYLVSYAADVIIVVDASRNFSKPGSLEVNTGYAYTAFTALSILLFFKELFHAWRIVKSDDVSDAFTNDEAFRYYSVRSFKHFLFLQSVAKNKTILLKMAFFVYFTLKHWMKLLFVELPMFVIAIILITLPNERTDIQWTIAIVSLVLKLAILGFKSFSLFVSLVAYCCVRPLLKGKSLQAYCSEQIDQRIQHLFHDLEAGPKKTITERAHEVGEKAEEIVGKKVDMAVTEVQEKAGAKIAAFKGRAKR